MPFDAADFDGRDRPTPDHSRWEWLSDLLHRLALLLARAALLGVALLIVACVVVVVTGNRPECVIFDPFQVCR